MVTERSAGTPEHHLLHFLDCKGHLKEAEALKSEVWLRAGAAAVVLLCKQICCQCVTPSHHTHRFFKWTMSLCQQWLFSFSWSLVHRACLYFLHPKFHPISWVPITVGIIAVNMICMYNKMISNISRLNKWVSEAFKEHKIKNLTYDKY